MNSGCKSNCWMVKLGPEETDILESCLFSFGEVIVSSFKDVVSSHKLLWDLITQNDCWFE